MDSNTDQNLREDLLSFLTEKYSRLTNNQVESTEALEDALSLISCCKDYYYEPSISQYYDLFLRLADVSETYIPIIESIIENIRYVDSDEYLPNLALLLILQIEMDILDDLDPSIVSYFNKISKSDPIEKTVRGKRDRHGEVIEIDKYSYFIEYLTCLSFHIFTRESFDEVGSLFLEVKSTLSKIIFLEGSFKTDYPKLYHKKLANMIRCIGLFLGRSNLRYMVYFQAGSFEKVFKVLEPHFSNEEISIAWLEVLLQNDIKKPKPTLKSYLPNTLINTIHRGSNLIRNTFLKLIKSARIHIFMDYLTSFDNSLPEIQDFKEQVFMIGIMKFHSQNDEIIKNLFKVKSCLLTLNDSRPLPDYCYEMLLLLHRRSLIAEMNVVIMDFLTNFHLRLFAELVNMDLPSLCKAGEYISLLPLEEESKKLAKQWIQSVIKPEILIIQNEDIFCLYIRILVLAYTPQDHDHFETSIIELNNLWEQLETIIKDNRYLGQRYWVPYADRISEFTYISISRLQLINRLTDGNFDRCKVLFTNLSVFLQTIAGKITRSIKLDMGIEPDQLHNISEKELTKNLKALLGHLSIKIEGSVKDLVGKKLPSILQYADTSDLFNPKTVYKYFDSLLLWNGLVKILEFAVKYYQTNDRDTQASIIDDIMKWSYNLASLTASNYLKFLNCQELNDTTKAYITHQVFLCSVYKIKSMSALYSSIMKFIFIEPTNAIDYDTTLRYVLTDRFLDLIAQIRGITLDKSIINSLKGRVFYGPLDSSTDGQTIYGGYIILNQKYKAHDNISKASAKLTLAHELAHLISRLEGCKYKYLTVSPKKLVRFQSAGADSSSSEKIEAGEYLETQLFGFKVKYINDQTVEFLNSKNTWSYSLKRFKEEFKRCLRGTSGDMISLKRHTPSERDSNGKECVYRFPFCLRA